MVSSKYFGKVTESWQGFAPEKRFNIPYFDENEELEVYLGAEYDEDGEEIDTPPTKAQLNEYERTLQSFIDNVDSVIDDIRQKAYEYYQQRYAHYYEQPFEDIFGLYKGTETENDATHPPLRLDTEEKHFEYMKEILNIRILEGNMIKIDIHYLLDTEHGLELNIIDNKVAEIGGIAEI